MANEHLLEVADGDTEAVVKIDTEGYVPRVSEVSGHLAPGQYKMTVEVATLVNKKSRPGKNWKFLLREVNSETRIFNYTPVPIGNPGEKDYETARSFNCALLYSIASDGGKTKTRKEVPINAKWFVGKTCYVRLEDHELGPRTISTVAAFISKEQFELSPGPFVTTSKPQVTVPEILAPTDGNARASSEAVAQMLGL